MRNHYFKGNSFWNSEPGNNDSWIWKSLLKLRHVAKNFIRCSVGNGNSASFWFDHWLEVGPLIDLIGHNSPRLLGTLIDSVVADVTNSSGWRLPSMRIQNPALSALRHTLLHTATPSSSLGLDTYYWFINGSSNRYFSSPTTWEELRPRKLVLTWSKSVWFKGYIPKHAFTFWVMHLDRLPVRYWLARWGINTTTSCGICNQNDETRDHLMLHCSFSKQVWDLLLNKLGNGAHTFGDWSDLMAWLAAPISKEKLTLRRLAIQATFFYLWKERNSRTHNGSTLTHTDMFKQIDRCIKDIIFGRLHRKTFSNLLSLWSTYE